mmetsp:Transcript_129941/g.238816  ORF Transcript_129941/g.238816 Transcript_129941/m.238816 type:complete len:410 (+) Transcript_129941:73-1302(+)
MGSSQASHEAKTRPGASCDLGDECPLWQAALRHEVNEAIIIHLQTYKHCNRLPCCHGAGCSRFRRVEAGEEKPYDIMHLLTWVHPPRIGMAMSEACHAYTTMRRVDPPFLDYNNNRSTPIPTSYHASIGEFIPDHLNGWPVDGWGSKEVYQKWHLELATAAGVEPDSLPLRVPPADVAKSLGIGDGTPSLMELVEEVTREGFGHELTMPGGGMLQDKAVALASHPRNTGIVMTGWTYFGSIGNMSILAPPARPAAILAVIIYTGTEVFGKLNADKRKHYDASSFWPSTAPRFPVLDKLLMEARFCLSPTSYPVHLNSDDRHWKAAKETSEVLWCGMHKCYLSKKDREAGFFDIGAGYKHEPFAWRGRIFLGGSGNGSCRGNSLAGDNPPDRPRGLARAIVPASGSHAIR